MTGKDWSEVEPEMKNTRDYVYQNISQNLSADKKAVVALTAIDDSNRKMNCYMLLTIGRYNNKITSASIQVGDTALKMSKSESYSMMLNYNKDATNLLTDIISIYASYETTSGAFVYTTAEDILVKLNDGFDAKSLSITYNTASMGFYSLSTSNDIITNDYSFNFTCNYE